MLPSKLMNQIRFLPYRVIRRIGTADMSCVLGIKTSELHTPELGGEFRFVEITSQNIREMRAAYPEFFDERQVEQLMTGQFFGVAVFQQDALAGFAWLGIGNIPAESNHNGDVRTGLPIDLLADTGYVYNVLVLPDYRGRRLYGSIMGKLAQRMQSRGVSRLILTTDVMNTSSLKALHRMGFQDLGRAWLFRIGPFSMASYPPSPIFDTVRFGKYTGDTRVSRE
jgi:ribosomal protein S18 acetylase RimI-like enzyme